MGHDDQADPAMWHQANRIVGGMLLHTARGHCGTGQALLKAEIEDDPRLAVEVAHAAIHLINAFAQSTELGSVAFAESYVADMARLPS